MFTDLFKIIFNFSVSVKIPLNVTRLRLAPPSPTAGSALYIFGGPSDIHYPAHFNGIVNNLFINKMKPIISYALKDPEYSLHGYGNLLSQQHCYPDV
jgi:hypothetical protein